MVMGIECFRNSYFVPTNKDQNKFSNHGGPAIFGSQICESWLGSRRHLVPSFL